MLFRSRSSGNPYLTQVGVFDVYKGDQVQSGQKSVAFALEFLSEDHTLTQEEINGIMKNILSSARSKLNAQLRG